MRVDNLARVTYVVATPAVRLVSSELHHPTAIADNAVALGQLFARLAGLRDESSLV
jgi:hypothetical protein